MEYATRYFGCIQYIIDGPCSSLESELTKRPNCDRMFVGVWILLLIKADLMGQEKALSVDLPFHQSLMMNKFAKLFFVVEINVCWLEER